MINLSLTKLLLSVSYILDFVEMDILGVTSNHSKRVAYISFNIAKELGMSDEECFDIVSLAILHDNGLVEKALKDNLDLNYHEKRKFFERFRDHCIIGEQNIKGFPFLTDTKDVIKYHHERYDGKGYYRVKGEDIPLMAQIISVSDIIDAEFNMKESYGEKAEKISEYLKEEENKIASIRVIQAFNKVSNRTSFGLDLKDEFINKAIERSLPSFKQKLSYSQIRDITKVFSKIIDCKSRFTSEHSSGLAEKVKKMAEYYNKSEEEKIKLAIAADLHDIGKLAISNIILEKPSKLNDEEFKIMKSHTYYTRICLESLDGFEDIVEWSSNHHEKLNGEGYPFGISADELDFNARLMGCLDVYQALTEERPYRKGMSHEKAMEILYEKVSRGRIDEKVVKDIDKVFG